MSTESLATTRLHVVIIRNAQTYDFGGGERFPVDLAAELSKHEIEPVIVSRSPRLLAYARSRGIRMVRGWWWSRQQWSGRSVLLFPAYLVWQLCLTLWYGALFARLRPDVVHPQSKDDFIAASIAGRLFGARVIWTDHADLKYIFRNHAVYYKNPVGKLVYLTSKLASSITLVSDSERQLVAAALGRSDLPERFQVVHNGITPTAIPAKELPDRQKGSFIYCATSRLVNAKGIGELLTAFNSVHAQHTDTRLWLVGDGPDMAGFQKMAAGDSSVTFFGHQDAPLPYVAAADVFVHPSHHEGFSLSLVEAAMLAKPIIACDVGGNPEIIRHDDTGLLVPARSADRLRDAMLTLYQDRQLASRLARSAHRTYERSFTFDRIVGERFTPLYRGRHIPIQERSQP